MLVTSSERAISRSASRRELLPKDDSRLHLAANILTGTGTMRSNVPDALEELCKHQADNHLRVLQVFRQMDTDGSGDIDMEEMRQALDALRITHSDTSLRKMFVELDKDGNGTVDYAELNRALRRNSPHGLRASSGHRAPQVLPRLDLVAPTPVTRSAYFDSDDEDEDLTSTPKALAPPRKPYPPPPSGPCVYRLPTHTINAHSGYSAFGSAPQTQSTGLVRSSISLQRTSA